jgi:hypothetical protein
VAAGMLGDGLPLAPGGESSPSAAEQAASGEDVHQPGTTVRARCQSTLVRLQSLRPDRGLRSGQQPPDHRRAAGGGVQRFERGAGAQFNGPDVTSVPPIGPPVVAAAAGPESWIVSRVLPHTA